MSELGRDEDTPRRDWEREVYKREEAQMTEPTPRTDALVLKADGVQSIHDADGWHFEPEIEAIITDARSLERSLARKEVLLRDIEAAMRSPGTNMVGLQTLLKRIERELKG